jgi:hypothetical protein
MGRITEITESMKIPIKAMEAQRKALATSFLKSLLPAGLKLPGDSLASTKDSVSSPSSLGKYVMRKRCGIYAKAEKSPHVEETFRF